MPFFDNHFPLRLEIGRKSLKKLKALSHLRLYKKVIYQENTDIFADFPLFFLNELVQKGSFQPCLKKADVTQNFEKAQER